MNGILNALQPLIRLTRGARKVLVTGLMAAWGLAGGAAVAQAAANPHQGPGGPILVVTSPEATFGTFYAEILRTEGFNEFSVADVSALSAGLLASYDVVVLAKVPVNAGQVATLTDWVNEGGNLIAMDPGAPLAGLLGVTMSGSPLANGYILPNPSHEASGGIAATTLQFHGTASRYTATSATSIATLYATATQPTSNAAITLRQVGSNGGQAAAFSYDLATSIVYTRQGNPAWAAQERDGVNPRRSDDMFFGQSTADPQPDWINLDKVAIPQADEQQRLLANMITLMNLDRKPLPRFWYFPRGHRAVVILTGDDHAFNGTQPQFERYRAASPVGCSVADWECVRATSYLFVGTPLNSAQAAAFEAQGFEIGVHINTGCNDYTVESLAQTYAQQLDQFTAQFPGVLAPSTQRHHCIVWSDWATGAKTQLNFGMRLDTNYYYWPPGWVNDRPGHFTGSAMPMRFADLDGSLIDVYQVVTQMTDESGQSYPFTSNTLLARAVGPEEQYGVYTVNAHTDMSVSPEGDAVVASAQLYGVPVVSARQMLHWLDGRNASAFSNLTWAGNQLSFSITVGQGANHLRAMLPYKSAGGTLQSISRSSQGVEYEVIEVKGVDYARFVANAGNYLATYAVDSTPPTVTSRSPGSGATGVGTDVTASVTFSEPINPDTISSNTIELRDATGTLVSAAVNYAPASMTATIDPNSILAYGATYTVTVKGGATGAVVRDVTGNALTANVSWSFTTSAGPACPCSAFPSDTVPAVVDGNDASAVELGVKFQADVSGNVTGIRFYKAAANTGTHVGNLWSSTGQLLASAVFTNETASGWQQVTFAQPVAITANTTYVASYHAPNGHYSISSNFFSNALIAPPLRFPSSTQAGGNGVFAYGGSQYPANSWNASNYYVDVSFTAGALDTTSPTVAINSPTTNSTFATSQSSIALGGVAADNVGVTQVSWNSDRGGTGTATGTSAWTVSSIALQSGLNNLTVTARDATGNIATDILAVTYTPPGDTTPPVITGTSPLANATDVAANSVVTVTFNEALDSATVSTSTFELRNAVGVLVPSTVSYNSTTRTATIQPGATLAESTTHTLTVRGGTTDPRVKDVAGNALAANFTLSFSTAAAGCPCSVWSSSTVPGVTASSDTGAVNLGMKFRATVDGTATGVRFYKGTGNTGQHVGSLWTSSGQLLASVAFTNESATGWQQAYFSNPVSITAGTTYVVSYLAPNGRYAINNGYFASQGVNNGVLQALSNVEGGGNGVYAYSSSSTFPASSWNSSNYWVDVVFLPAAAVPDNTPPTILSRSPAVSATNVSPTSVVTVDFSEGMNAATITSGTVQLYAPGTQLVAAAVSYSGTGFRATLTPSAALQPNTTYTVIVRGGGAEPVVRDVAGNTMTGLSTWIFTTGDPSAACGLNAITAENCLPGNPASEWDVIGAGDPSIQGFATQMSVNRGQTVRFKVDTNAGNYRFDIYRMGFYGGQGARKVATVQPSASLPQSQPSCITQAATGLIDCGNWVESGSWAVPANATSGIYFARLVRTDTGGASHVFFVVRNDASTSDLVFQTSDTTWQAYNNYGGNSLYQGGPGTNPGRAYKVSYNRPFATRAVDGGQDWVFNSEYPMVRWLESNGYDVAYISGIDTHRDGSKLLNHKAFLSVGHDEYWSAEQRANVEAARDQGKHLAFFSGNEIFWKIRWENSIDGSGAQYRTMVSYKETHAGAKIDPSAEWTGTWRDPRLSPPSDGGRPENALTGTMFTVNTGTAAIIVPAAEGKMRFWRNTSIATLAAGQSATLTASSLGYEWDSDLDNGFRPAGLIRMSDTTVNNVDLLLDHGSSFGPGTANHALTFYKHSSGARVFGAGTIQWSWGLDAVHDRAGSPVDARMQQATVNLFADMDVQPATLQANLVLASASGDSTAPTVTISAPAANASVPQGAAVVISGTATDVGGVVGGVEVSVDGGLTWRRAEGRASWSFSWTPAAVGQVTIRVRASDDSGNFNLQGTSRTVTVTSAGCPCSLWSAAQSPAGDPDIDPAAQGGVELGTRFRTSRNGNITAIRFYKNAGNTGAHVASLWSSTGTLLGRATFSGESASGWQQVNLASPVPVTANTWYVVSYHSTSGSYMGVDGFFASQGVTNGPLYAARDGEGGANGLYRYTSSPSFPSDTWASEGYWVDVVFQDTQ